MDKFSSRDITDKLAMVLEKRSSHKKRLLDGKSNNEPQHTVHYSPQRCGPILESRSLSNNNISHRRYLQYKSQNNPFRQHPADWKNFLFFISFAFFFGMFFMSTSSTNTMVRGSSVNIYERNKPFTVKLEPSLLDYYEIENVEKLLVGQAWIEAGRLGEGLEWQHIRGQHSIELSDEEYDNIYHPITSDEERRRGKLYLPSVYSAEAMVGRRDLFLDEDCKEMKPWQLMNGGYPTCNLIHENDLAFTSEVDFSRWITLLNHGYWRDVWKISDWSMNNYVLKTQRYEHDFHDRNIDRQRRDALATERLTSSDHVVDIYGYCGYSAINQFSEGGDIESMIWGKHAKDYSPLEALRAARDIAAGVNAMHTFDGDLATIAHADITTGQFILIDGTYRLTDFNRCRFIRLNKTTNEPCPFHINGNPGTFRSPEEYDVSYTEEEGGKKRNRLSEKVDIFSMGNVFYSLLTKLWPFEDFDHDEEEDVKIKIMNGEKPYMPEDIENNSDPSVKALIEAMNKCHVLDPNERASAFQILSFLSDAIVDIENNRDQIIQNEASNSW